MGASRALEEPWPISPSRDFIAADPGTVVDVIGDVEAYPEWTDQMREVTVLTTDDAGWPDQAQFTVDVGILQDTYVLEYVWDVAEDGSGARCPGTWSAGRC